MKKVNQTNRVLNAVLATTAFCALTVSPALADPSAGGIQAGLNPIGPGYSAREVQIMHEVGGATTHDADMMRYDKNQRRSNSDYYQYEQKRYGTGGSAVKNYATPETSIPDAMKATVDEMGSKGVYVNSIEVSPSEILTKVENLSE